MPLASPLMALTRARKVPAIYPWRVAFRFCAVRGAAKSRDALEGNC